ncbi:MAG: 4-phosphopantetheinyl transferase family protein [Clostridia bacterium]|nr:4-phosphopantetheinyl transferase family protein [Clostridia bacterium]
MAIKTFIFENISDKEKRHAQVQSALREYTGIDSAEVYYNNRGKPFIKGLPEEMYISVTTADEVMVVVFSDKPVGIDGERLTRFENDAREKKPDYISLAERFFTGEEAEYVREGSVEGEQFANVWVRKEAYVKYTGKGLSDFANFSVVDGSKFLSKVNGVPIKKLNVVFPGSNDYLFIIAGEN